jgi:FAD/FMN-containing dehydrogenase
MMSRRGINRRDYLKALVKTAILAPALLSGSRAAASAHLPPLPSLPESEALLLTPRNGRFAHYQPAYNHRTMLEPKLRAMCKTPNAVTTMIQWLRLHQLPFAVRSGGHSFEGLSQSDSVVIDTRMMNAIDIDTASETVSVGPGASLGAIYEAVGARGYAVSAGSCPTVGVAGHALGGGYGLLSRQFGLLCDSLKSLEIADPDASIISADPQQNADLFWASRGGGGGCFGIATRFRLQIFPLNRVVVFSISWLLPAARARNVVKAWQAWAPNAPDAITSMLKISMDAGGKVSLRCEGQSVGSADQLRQELRSLLASEAAQTAPRIRPMSFLQAVDHFSEGWRHESTYSKDKSDVLLSLLSEDGIATLIDGLQHVGSDEFTVVLYAYGGAIARTASPDTPFPYRNAICCIQYDLLWQQPAMVLGRLAQIQRLYAAMRPYVSGAAYVNYCDADLQNWREAYWGPNLPRLQAIKARFDPEGVFRHAQSI